MPAITGYPDTDLSRVLLVTPLFFQMSISCFHQLLLCQITTAALGKLCLPFSFTKRKYKGWGSGVSDKRRFGFSFFRRKPCPRLLSTSLTVAFINRIYFQIIITFQ
jgi:hypothetical protein